MRVLKCPSVILLLAFMLFVLPHFALAELEVKELPGNIHFGPVRVHPQFSIKGAYTDNYFLESDDEKENWVAVLIPGITVQVPFKSHMLQLDYRAEVFRHSDYSQYDAEDHCASGLLDLKFPWGLEVKVGDEFIQSATRPEFLGDTLDDYNYNEGMVEASYRLANHFKVKVAYRNVFKDFWKRANELDNFVRNEASAGVYYRFLPKTSVLVEYTFYHMDNEDRGFLSTDNDNHHIWAGLEWEPGAKIKGGIKGGYIMRRYDEFGKDEDNFGMRGDLTYFLTNFITLRLEAVREIIQTEFTGEETVFGTHYVRTGGSFSFGYTFPFWTGGLHKLGATLEGFYYNDDFRERGIYTRERRDDRLGGSAEMTYQFWDRIGLTVKYRYVDNNSNFDWEDYRENQGFVQISIVL